MADEILRDYNKEDGSKEYLFELDEWSVGLLAIMFKSWKKCLDSHGASADRKPGEYIYRSLELPLYKKVMLGFKVKIQ